MVVDVQAKFNLVGTNENEYEIEGKKVKGYKAKLDQPDGVYNVKITEDAYKSMKDLPAMTPIIATCRVTTHADKDADRFKVINASPVKAAPGK